MVALGACWQLVSQGVGSLSAFLNGENDEEMKRSLGLLETESRIILPQDEGGPCHKNEEKEGTNHGSIFLGNNDWLEIHSSIGKSSGQTVHCPENYVCRRGRVWLDFLFLGGMVY